jgi:GAF domain-containing protein
VSDDGRLAAAAAAGMLSDERQHRALLQSVVEVARAIFRAPAASIFLYDPETDELVFEAVASDRDEGLVGRRFPSSTGIAGFVLVTRQSLVLDDVARDPRFAREVAESTGYVPRSLMAVPIEHDEQALGVLEVLDRPAERPFTLAEMDLLALFANQAAIALDLLQKARRAGRAVGEDGAGASAVAAVAARVERLEGPRRAAAERLLQALSELL